MFIGREREIKEIAGALASDRFESILLYGRRRVGKTEIIRESLRRVPDIPSICFECQRSSVESNLQRFSVVVNDFLDLGNAVFSSFESALETLFKRSLSGPMALAIDEFSFLLDKDPSLESVLAVLIDRYKTESKMKLFISGSYVGLMEAMVEGNSHSYGRFNHIFHVRPFDYYDASLFYPNYSNEDKIAMYSVFGGVPYFNSLIDPSKSAEENIKSLVVAKDSILEHEITEMLLAETKKIDLLNDIIALVGKGVDKYSDLVAMLSQDKAARPKYLLDKLVDMDLLEIRYPINAKSNAKMQRYALKDNLLRFYYRFIFDSPYSLLRENPDLFFDRFIKKAFEEQYVPKSFERISREFLVRRNILGEIDPPFFEIGEYVVHDRIGKKNRQFDVVTRDERGYISFECKYSKNPIGEATVKEEFSQTGSLQGISFYRLGFISKSGFSPEFDKSTYACYSLDDFYRF